MDASAQAALAQQDDIVQAATKLPIPDRITHRNWRVREAVYKQLTDKFAIAPEDDDIYSHFFSYLPKIARDSNAAAQLAAFETVIKYADTAPSQLVRKSTAEIIKAIVEKGLAARPINKTKAIETFVMFVAADAGDIAVDVITSLGFKHRTPKVVAASVDAITSALDIYGSRAVPIKLIVAKIPPLLNHSQELVRNCAKTLVIQLHRWAGDRVKVVLKDAKEVTVKEIESVCATHVKSKRPKPKKLTRAMEQRARRTGSGPNDQDQDDGFGEAFGEEEEPEAAVEINLLDKISTIKVELEDNLFVNWYVAVDSKKWKARKDALDAAIDAIGDARLTVVSYNDVFARLRKIISKDTNVNVVASAAKLVSSMAHGLKKNFPSQFAKALTADLLKKTKEKNKIVTDAISKALDALHLKKCIRVTDLLEEISVAGKQKAPKARYETLSWLARCICEGTAGIDLKGAPLKSFGGLFLVATDDSAPDVRDAGITGLAALQILVGERNVLAFTEKLDKKRKDKVAAMVVNMPKRPKKEPMKPSVGPYSNTRSRAAKRASSVASRTVSPTPLGLPIQESRETKPRKLDFLESDDESESPLTPEDALSKAAELFEAFESGNWSAKSFRARAAAATAIISGLEEREAFTADDVALILGILQCRPGLEDSNFIATKPKLELFNLVASKCSSPPPRKSLRPLLLCAMEKLGDIKSAKMAAGTLMSFAEATSPRFCIEALLMAARETKNSRALIGMMKLGMTLVEDFGIPPVPEKNIAELAALGIANAAPAAKTSAVAMACKAAIRTGAEKFRSLLESSDASQDVLELFDSEIQKYTQKPDAPTRKKRFGISSPPQEDNSTVEKHEPEPSESEVEESQSIMSTLKANNLKEEQKYQSLAIQKSAKKPRKRISIQPPTDSTDAASEQSLLGKPTPKERVSIASHFAPGSRIFLDLKNSNWKRRQEALESVLSIVERANDFVKPNVGSEILFALRARLNDSNRNLAVLAYSVASRMMRAMGPGGVLHLKVFAPLMLGQGCIDIKKNVREAAMKCVNTTYEVYGLPALIPYCQHPFSSLNSNVRKEFLDWLVPRLQGQLGNFESSQEDLSNLVDPCLVCLRDRVAEVRHLADLALEQVVRSVGLNVIEGKLLSLTKSARLQLESTLEKYRGGHLSAQRESANISKSSTPSSGRERPKSIAVPRTPLTRKANGSSDEATPAMVRRRRPMSARPTPVARTLNVSESPQTPKDQEPMLKANSRRDARAQKFMQKRMKLVEALSVSDPEGEIPPLMGESLEDIAEDLPECCSQELFVKLTAPANRFRMHVEAVDMIGSELDLNPDNLAFVADVLFRWAACRIEDSKTPPTVLVRLASFISTMSEILMSSGVKIVEYEASAIIPPLVEKCGSNRESVREAMRAALLTVADIVEEDVLLVMYTSCLRHPMSERAHSEISAEICQLIDKRCNAGAGLPRGILPVIGRVAGGEDDGAGCAAAACLERAHEHFGDGVWELVGELSNTEAALLDDRLTTVINGMKQELGSVHNEVEDLSASVAKVEDVPKPVVAPAPETSFPNDIRNEDFRLSVAPAPPSSVLASISDSLGMTTPQKTKAELRQEHAPETPAMPLRNRAGTDSNNGSAELVTKILSMLTSKERDIQLSGLASIFEDVKRDSKLITSSRGSKILLQLVRCFGDTLDRLQKGSAFGDDPAVLKSFLKGVIRYAREAPLLRQLDQSSVELLLTDALGAMVPQAVAEVDDWDQVRRGVNLMIVKVLESCDENLLFTALINLLLSNIRTIQRSDSGKASALAKSSICIKSIAKVAKRGFGTCRVNELLRDIHLFLMANPVRRNGGSSAEDQTFAMRLLKTVVNAIIDKIGSGIQDNLDLIPQPEKSQLVHYIDMTLRDEEQGNPKDLIKSQASLAEVGRLTKLEEGDGFVQIALASIEPSADSQEQLLHLRSILRAYPEVDLKSQLGSFSPEVREHVHAGLLRLSSQDSSSQQQGNRDNLSDQSGSSVTKSPSRGQSGSGSGEDNHGAAATNRAGQVYLKRLHEIQLRYGLQATSRSQQEADGRANPIEKENGEVVKLPSVDEAKGKAFTLRERMARIREMQSASKF